MIPVNIVVKDETLTFTYTRDLDKTDTVATIALDIVDFIQTYATQPKKNTEMTNVPDQRD